MPITRSLNLSGLDEAIVVQPHELVVWDSTQELAFDIRENRYGKFSVLVPQRMLRATQDACALLHCALVDKKNVLSELCVQHMGTLAKFINTQLRLYELSLGSVTTSLFDSMIASLIRPPRDRDQLIAEIKNYIECYLTDEELSPSSIAAAFDISTRYAHKLFADRGHTIGTWILERRLDRSLEDLMRDDVSITHTAFRWGFKDLGHYSRSFKNRFQVSPSEYRKQAAVSSETS